MFGEKIIMIVNEFITNIALANRLQISLQIKFGWTHNLFWMLI